ncbi:MULTISPECIES: heavy-metal-associated domain-containing protein [Nocardia]|nr:MULTISPECIES: heavy-metal-associated domain-containing protein [Nocardia]
MSEATYTVRGMTCGHCANAVTRELLSVTGVHGVDVDVACGRVVVTSERQVGEDEVRAAVTEAGFELVG